MEGSEVSQKKMLLAWFTLKLYNKNTFGNYIIRLASNTRALLIRKVFFNSFFSYFSGT